MGALLYAAQGTRPDLASAINDAAKHNIRHGAEHWHAVKRIIKYAKTTAHQGLAFGRDKNIELTAYVDADFASDRKNRRSTTGYVIIFGSGPICWKSQAARPHDTINHGGRICGSRHDNKKICWIRNLLKELGFEQTKPTVIYEVPSV